MKIHRNDARSQDKGGGENSNDQPCSHRQGLRSGAATTQENLNSARIVVGSKEHGGEQPGRQHRHCRSAARN